MGLRVGKKMFTMSHSPPGYGEPASIQNHNIDPSLGQKTLTELQQVDGGG